MPTSICHGIKRRVGRAGLETHAVEVLDEPCQILVSQVWNGASELASPKAAAELFAKLWRSLVEVAELLQRVESDHVDDWLEQRPMDLV